MRLTVTLLSVYLVVTVSNKVFAKSGITGEMLDWLSTQVYAVEPQ
jgi:hypothetical protein